MQAVKVIIKDYFIISDYLRFQAFHNHFRGIHYQQNLRFEDFLTP